MRSNIKYDSPSFVRRAFQHAFSQLHPFVQRLYPEMGKAAAINEDVSEAEWLQSLLILKAEELEKEDEVEIGVSVSVFKLSNHCFQRVFVLKRLKKTSGSLITWKPCYLSLHNCTR